MKIKHPNFNHLNSNALDLTHVPEHLIRKHWSLQIVEMHHLVICLIVGIFVYKAFAEHGVLQTISPILLLLAFLAAALLSITDDYRFRIMIFLSHLLLISIAFFALLFYSISLASIVLFSILVAQSLLVIAIVFLPRKNKSYYNWCKSIAGKI